MHKYTPRELTLAAMVAAIYAVMSYFGNLFGITFGPIQFRFAEALCVLPFLIPASVPGLFLGCLITNLLSPYGPLDIVLGSAATLLAALWTRRIRYKWLAPLPPVVCNAVIVGAEIAWYMTGFGPGFWTAYALNAASVALGEALSCYILGSLLLRTLPRIQVFRDMIPAAQLKKLNG